MDSFKKGKARELNSLALAYMGDAVFEVYVRKYLLEKGKVKTNVLQREATKYVSAKAQSYIIHILIEEKFLDEDELAVAKRGRNAKSHTIPKNTDVQTYKYSTAFECLIGYHYLSGNLERLEQIVTRSFFLIDHREEAHP